MSITMHSASVPIFVRMLKNVDVWLDNARPADPGPVTAA